MRNSRALSASKNEGDTTQFDLAVSAGLVLMGPFSGRKKDDLGVALALERNSEKYRIASGKPVASEKLLELGYRYHAMPGLVIQPFCSIYSITATTPPRTRYGGWVFASKPHCNSAENATLFARVTSSRRRAHPAAISSVHQVIVDSALHWHQAVRCYSPDWTQAPYGAH